MYPTLRVGDHFFVDTQRYFTHWPELGEVVVFIEPGNNENRRVGRITGLPGDRIQMRGGVLHINDVAVNKVRVEDFIDLNGEGVGRPVPQFEEALSNGVRFRVLDTTATGEGDDTEEYVVPDHNYFIMGVNRDNSQDSRYLNAIGYVPRENIIAKATSVYFSWTLSRIGTNIR